MPVSLIRVYLLLEKSKPPVFYLYNQTMNVDCHPDLVMKKKARVFQSPAFFQIRTSWKFLQSKAVSQNQIEHSHIMTGAPAQYEYMPDCMIVGQFFPEIKNDSYHVECTSDYN